MTVIGNRIKELRTDAGLSQDALAEELKTTRSCIGNYEQGTRKPDYEMMENIADFFNVDMDYLTGRQNQKRKQILKKMQLYIEEGKAPFLVDLDEKDRFSDKDIERFNAYLRKIKSQPIKLDIDEKKLIVAYRKADDLTKSMVKKILEI